MGGTCTPDTCTNGAQGCPCRTGGTACDGTGYCDGMQVCQACTPEVAGCPCGAGNACLSGLACDTAKGTCRVARTCADLAADGTCVPHQACVEGVNADATCTAKACQGGFKWFPPTGECVACASANCSQEPQCTAGDGGVLDACDALNRACTADGTSAWCTDCKSGFTPPPGDGGVTACLASPLCGPASCSYDQYCDVSTGSPICTAWPCPTGQAKPAGGGACVSCGTKTCAGPGTTGRVWPILGAGDVCLCETRAGFFSPNGRSGDVIACDVDHDGWVNALASPEAFQSDPAGLANMRCDIRHVDRVRLQDEYGVAVDVLSCAAGLLVAPDAGACGAPVLMDLLESEANDTPGQRELNGAVGFPPYGPPDAGRYLVARELNGLTKACVTLNGDFDKDGVDDITQVQAANPGTNGQLRLHSFAYFLELADSWYVPGAAGAPGALVIAERSRCDLAFPLHYAIPDGGSAQPAEAYDGGDGSSYWRSCARRRDPMFNANSADLAMDFGRFVCANPMGSCPAEFPAHPTLGGAQDPAKSLMRHHGLCELGGARPQDGLWRGLLHHSQFKCANVTTVAVDRTQAGNATVYNFQEFASVGEATVGKFVFNACAATRCTGPTDPACRTALGSGDQPSRPSITCRATPVVGGEVGFAAVGFFNYSNPSGTTNAYRGGCVNEDVEAPAGVPPPPSTQTASYVSWLCPYPEYNILPERAPASFGRYACYGDLPNFLWSDGSSPAPRATLFWAFGSDGGVVDTLHGFFR